MLGVAMLGGVLILSNLFLAANMLFQALDAVKEGAPSGKGVAGSLLCVLGFINAMFILNTMIP